MRLLPTCALGLGLTLAQPLLGGCGSPGTGTLTLSWSFVDGRSCLETGATTVEVTDGTSPLGPLGSFACDAGLEPKSVTVTAVPQSSTLTVSAESPEGAELYRGTVVLDGALSPARAILYATGAE